ncbi:hypothetical protein [Larkinella punicea]|uniref:DUF3592 domain-containing protein n=1 Tax=Larkinella punicea TaxID=2315727 RepID=A0A368JIS1_9BACT|nr:hypothetical protein [Larkinella punicea]RCR66443.1 hypothetical protein DUE52_26565 [Larkinella punicea]
MGEEVKGKNTEWPSSKVILMAFSSLLLSLAAAPKFYTIYKRKQIQKDQAFAVGTISRFKYERGRARDVYRVEVQYNVDGKLFTGKCRAFWSLREWQLDSLLEEKLPVVYEKADPSNSVILSNEEQFGHFGLAFPDSLIWTRQYFY